MKTFDIETKSIMLNAESGKFHGALHAIASIMEIMQRDNDEMSKELTAQIEKLTGENKNLTVALGVMRESIKLLESQLKEFDSMRKMLDNWKSPEPPKPIITKTEVPQNVGRFEFASSSNE